MNPYSYTRTEPQFNLKLVQTTRKWLRYKVDFPTAFPLAYEKNNTVRGEYLQPRGVTKAPLVIFFHGMGDEILIPPKLLARALVKKGIACFILYSVFHSSRTPEGSKKQLPDLTNQEWFERYQISVIDVRQVADWAARREEINEDQIALIGISFGGFISTITMGVDKRIKAGVLIISGANAEKIVWKSRKGSMRRYKLSEEEYYQNQKLFAQYLKEVAEKGFENVTPARNSFITDPKTFAPALRERPVLMLNALWDEYIPKETTLELWEACGKPEIAWFPSTHSTIFLFFPLISRKIIRFIQSTFANQDGQTPQ